MSFYKLNIALTRTNNSLTELLSYIIYSTVSTCFLLILDINKSIYINEFYVYKWFAYTHIHTYMYTYTHIHTYVPCVSNVHGSPDLAGGGDLPY